MSTKSEKHFIYVLAILLVLALIYTVATSWQALTQLPGQTTVISGGISVVNPSDIIDNTRISHDNTLIIKYSDGTEKSVGYYPNSQYVAAN